MQEIYKLIMCSPAFPSTLDLHSCLRLSENSFDSVIADLVSLPSDLQMEIIDLQSSDKLKDKIQEGNLIELQMPSSWPNTFI